MGTVVVLAIVAGAVALAVRSMIKDKKAGGSIQCGGDCSRCGGCHYAEKIGGKQRIPGGATAG